MYMTQDSYLEYIKNSQNSTVKNKTKPIQLENEQRYEETSPKRIYG